MKTKLMFIFMAFSIVVWAGAGLAAERPTASSGAGSGGEYAPRPVLDIQLWCQDPDPAGFVVSSQQDLEYPFESWMADDYVSAGDEAIEKVVWWGNYWNPGFVVHPDYFVISFYTDTGNCDPGLDGGVPSTPLSQKIVTTYDVTDLGGWYEYTADLTGDEVLQDAGTTYWISIQAGLVLSTGSQWGWQPALDQQLCPSVQLFPLLGTTEWTAPDPAIDMAFCLYASDDPIAVETSSWGSVKALFQ